MGVHRPGLDLLHDLRARAAWHVASTIRCCAGTASANWQLLRPLELSHRADRSRSAPDHRQRLSACPLFHRRPDRLGLGCRFRHSQSYGGGFGTTARTILFMPAGYPAGCRRHRLELDVRHATACQSGAAADRPGSLDAGWLGDFDFALPAVGVIGAWVLLGLCTMLLVTGITKIDPSLYEAANLDGASAWHEFLYITLPGLRQEIGVCATVTVIAALASFDIVYIATGGGPGTANDRAGSRNLSACLRPPAGRPRLRAGDRPDGLVSCVCCRSSGSCVDRNEPVDHQFRRFRAAISERPRGRR